MKDLNVNSYCLVLGVGSGSIKNEGKLYIKNGSFWNKTSLRDIQSKRLFGSWVLKMENGVFRLV